MSDFFLLINGQATPGVTTVDVVNPSTLNIVGQAPCASPEQLDTAVAAAKRAQPAWAAVDPAVRARALVQVAEAVDAHADELARLLVAEHGMPLEAARLEVAIFGYKLRDAAAADVGPREIEIGPGRRVMRVLRPLGVIGAIVPWNVPLVLLGGKLGPALMMGNTVVAKPAPTTPLSTLRIGEIAAEILPPGVLNIVSGLDSLGEQICNHPDVRMITFTGSTETGRKVAASAGNGLRRVLLELGGNDPAIVMADADVEATADVLVASAFMNGGQACIATKRVYAHRDVYDRLCASLKTRVEAIAVGDGMAPGVACGPMQNARQFARAQGFAEIAARDGTVIARAAAPQGPGYFMAPMLVVDLPDDSPLVAEEQFCPILPLLPFDDIEEAIARANNSIYGLGATVFSTDLDAAAAVAGRIEAGTVMINRVIDFDPRIPFCGAKASGVGIEGGDEGLLQYAQLQIVNA